MLEERRTHKMEIVITKSIRKFGRDIVEILEGRALKLVCRYFSVQKITTRPRKNQAVIIK